MKWVFGILLLIAAGMGGAYWWAGKDEVPLTDTARAAAPGEFADLTDGKLHYVVRGPETGPVILMVHGFSTPHFVFEQKRFIARGKRLSCDPVRPLWPRLV